MTELKAYDEALQSGQYQKPGGMLGKYDNVRRFWEDQQLGLYLEPYLEGLVTQKQAGCEKLRILDIGCGSGDGFDFVTHIDASGVKLSSANSGLITPDMLDAYVGVDINEGLLQEARAGFGQRPYMRFVHGDINGFDFGQGETFDLYLANYGTLSHNEDEQTVDLLARIARQSRAGAVIVVDWLGRYSYEWQTLWTKHLDDNRWMDYAISYIHADGGTCSGSLTHFPLRTMSRREAEKVCREAVGKAGQRLVLRTLADRSTFVGRHMDTAQYNPYAQPLRRLVNSLFEPDLSTDLDQLVVNYVPRRGFDEVNAYHTKLARWWNYAIDYTKALMAGDSPPGVPSEVPPVVEAVLDTMRNVVSMAVGMAVGNPRASLVEPQLAYSLRELERGLQKGLGCGHGLVAILQVIE